MSEASPASRLTRLLLVVSACFLFAAPALAQPVLPEVLQDLAPGAPGLSVAQRQALERLESDLPTRESRVVEVANLAGLERGESFFLTLFRSEGFAVSVRKVDHRGPADYSVFGDLENGAGWAVLVVDRGTVTGSVRTADDVYAIRPLGGARHAVLRLDPEGFAPEGEPAGTVGFVGDLATLEPSLGGGLQSVTASATTLTTIKVLVAYTPSAASAQGGNILNTIQLAVDETNMSYTNSGVDINLVKAHTVQVSYTESGSHSTDLSRFRGTSDGYMDNVHSLRNTYAADVMILILNNGSLCGLASTIQATATTAFATVHHSCAAGNYTFGHEIGHLQGARHDNDSGTTPYAYGHGYCYSPGNWRTVMAVGCSSLTRIPRWSNPLKTWNGVATGTSATNDNARVLNNTAATVAGFRSDPVFSVSISGPTSVPFKTTVTLTANVSNAPGSVSYKWFVSYDAGVTWFSGGTSQTQTAVISQTTHFKVEATSVGQVKTDTHIVWFPGEEPF